MSGWKRWVLSGALIGALACGDDSEGGGSGDGGTLLPGDGGLDGGTGDGRMDASRGSDAGDAGRGGGNGEGGGEDCDGLTARVRDMKDSHPDFEAFSGSNATRGLVAPMLENGKPKYTGICQQPGVSSSCPYDQQTTTEANFSQWYSENDIPDVSKSYLIKLPLTEVTPGSFEFNSAAFFPLDDDSPFFPASENGMPKGFGHQGRAHNFHFTTEVHTSFTYKRGDRFTFEGDDDLWIFVNGRLALDLGGLHPRIDDPATTTIDFDAQAGALGITEGGTYRMDIFHAERHTTASNFRIRTNIECFIDVGVI